MGAGLSAGLRVGLRAGLRAGLIINFYCSTRSEEKITEHEIKVNRISVKLYIYNLFQFSAGGGLNADWRA